MTYLRHSSYQRSLASIILILSLIGPYINGAQVSTAACTNRYAILVGGWNSESDGSGRIISFDDVVSQVLPEFNYGSRIRYFSYRSPQFSTYSKGDTYNALPDTAPSSLKSTINSILSECIDAELDLIGHSLGGVVIKDFLGNYLGSNEA